MNSIENMFNIDSSILKKSKEIEENLKCVYEEIEDIALYNQAKVLKAFKDNKVSQMHMNKTTGYGYNDVGREVIEKIYTLSEGKHLKMDIVFSHLKMNALAFFKGNMFGHVHDL